MEFTKTANLIIYRIREKGLEIFLQNDGEAWQLPEQPVKHPDAVEPSEKIITLDPVQQEDGQVLEAYAVEGDWHDIPSLKSLMMEDVHFMKHQIRQMIPDAMDKGAYFAVKEAFKRVLPHQYELLKELKDILTDRNSVKNI